jgi:hypothetical protein
MLWGMNDQRLLVFVTLAALPVTVSCAAFFPSAWYGNTAVQQCVVCIIGLRASCWFDCIHRCKHIVMEYSFVQKLRYGKRHKTKEKKDKEREG